jgi:periplasmic mercuric ion binding protein
MLMKIALFAVVATFAGTFSGFSAETVKLSDVHLCCQSCVKGAQAAVGKVEGASVTADRDDGTVTLTGPDTATVQKAADALVKGGYYGKSSDAKIKLQDTSGAKDQKVQSLKLEGVHLCCGKCVTVVDEAIKSVPGVKSHTAVKNAKSFEVTGDFNDKEVVTALHKAGLTGRVAK